MSQSSIEWTDKTWNPVTGCTKVSQGCKNCYAETIADRFFAKQYAPNADGSARKFTDVRCHPERLDQPLHWKNPYRVFVNSMSDLFHENVPFEFILACMARMVTADQHTYQILTKRPERALEFDRYMAKSDYSVAWRKNIWLGVSVENQKMADERIPLLLDTPAATRFLSVEPMLEAVSLTNLCGVGFDALYGVAECTRKIDWVICGGESGPGARPFNLAWAESLREQCKAAGVPFFMKQVGSKPVAANGAGLGHAFTGKGGDIAEWPEHLRVREFPKTKAFDFAEVTR